MKRQLAVAGRVAVLTVFVAGTTFGAPAQVRAQTAAAPPFFAGEVFDDAVTSIDNVVLLFNGSLDQASLPAASAFAVTVNGVSQTPSSVTIPYVMYEGPQGISLSSVRLGLATPIQPGQTGEVAYAPPTLSPLMVGVDPVPAFTGMPLDLVSAQGLFTGGLGIADEYRGRNHITALFTQQLTTGALPAPSDFSVTQTTSAGATNTFSPIALSVVYPGFGFGFLDLQLPVTLAWDDVVTFSYTPGTTLLWNLAHTESAPAFGPPDSGTVAVNLGQTPLSATVAGTGIVVMPDTSPGVPGPVNLTFGDVTQPGATYLTVTSTAPPPPAGYQIGSPPTYYDIQTTATYSGSITVCISYAGISPAPTSLLHYQNGAWADITTSIDATNHTICGSTTSLSPFALATQSLRIAGFLQPLNDPANPISVFKSGSTIPVKFELTHPDGSLILDSGASAIAASCEATISVVQTTSLAAPVDEVVTSTTPNSGNCFRYDATAHQFIFNLGTKGLATNGYTLGARVVGPDGTVLVTHALAIGLR